MISLLYFAGHRAVRPCVAYQQHLPDASGISERHIQAHRGSHGNPRKIRLFYPQMIKQGRHIVPHPVKIQTVPVRPAPSMSLLVQGNQLHTFYPLIDRLYLPDAPSHPMQEHKWFSFPCYLILQSNPFINEIRHI